MTVFITLEISVLAGAMYELSGRLDRDLPYQGSSRSSTSYANARALARFEIATKAERRYDGWKGGEVQEGGVRSV